MTLPALADPLACLRCWRCGSHALATEADTYRGYTKGYCTSCGAPPTKPETVGYAPVPAAEMDAGSRCSAACSWCGACT